MIIGIMGRAGVGKDTFATVLIQRAHNRNVHLQRKAFAAKLKQMLSVISDGQVPDKNKVHWTGKTGRELMQTLGTDWGRNMVEDDIWINALMREYSENQNWVVTDLRFPNECAAVKEKGGIIIKVTRDVEGMSHESETALDDYTGYDFLVINNGDFQNLDDYAHQVANQLGW